MADPSESRTTFTELLNRGVRGDREAWNEVLPRIYEELRRIAELRMSGERQGHTLQPTALVHEAYVKLVGNERIEWRDRGQFLQAAAEGMRRILVDHARKHRRLKREGSRRRKPASLVDLASQEDPEQVLAIDEALTQLEQEQERVGQIVRLRFFGGLSVEETADALGVSVRTTLREWSYARARLFRMLDSDGE